MDSSLNELVLQSNRIIDEAFSLYSLSEMALAFNGGKDCCVVLHLLYLYNSKYLEQMEIIHFVDEFEFPGITQQNIHYLSFKTLTLKYIKKLHYLLNQQGNIIILNDYYLFLQQI